MLFLKGPTTLLLVLVDVLVGPCSIRSPRHGTKGIGGFYRSLTPEGRTREGYGLFETCQQDVTASERLLLLTPTGLYTLAGVLGEGEICLTDTGDDSMGGPVKGNGETMASCLWNSDALLQKYAKCSQYCALPVLRVCICSR